MAPTRERSVYFDGWYPRQHCYHPSMPPRRLKMLDHLEGLKATMLVWASMGGGSISLPYLEQEANGDIPERMRFHGFVNDAEFIAQARKRGIKVFGIVFEEQGWEFPIETRDGKVIAMNELRGEGERGWMGLREFSTDALPGVWPPFAQYFPDGLRDADGEVVTDLLESGCSRHHDGSPMHAKWVESSDNDHYCYLMDRNSPAWREYLKAVVRIQIDAGVDGVQLDETASPLAALQYGGCFCKSCMRGFREHLATLPAERQPEGFDAETFHYGDWLRERGTSIAEGGADTPHLWDYVDYQRAAIRDGFAELADYVRAYGRQQGRDVLVTGNFYDVAPFHEPLTPWVDMMVTEMRAQRYRQPVWFRVAVAMAEGKQVVVVENPYGGVVPDMVERLNRGEAHDLLSLSHYEAAAMGTMMSSPYGAWMGAEIEDSFTAPVGLAEEIQEFQVGVEELSGAETDHEVAVLYSVESNIREYITKYTLADNRRPDPDDLPVSPFWEAADALAAAGVPFDVIMLHDGVIAPDDLTAERLARHRTVVVPGCHTITEGQLAALEAHVDGGGAVVVHDRFAENLDAARVAALTDRAHLAADHGPLPGALLPDGPQLLLEGADDVATTVRVTPDGGRAIHIVNYALDHEAGATVPAHDVHVRLRMDGAPTRATVHRPGHPPADVAVETGDGWAGVTLGDLRTYAIVHVHG